MEDEERVGRQEGDNTNEHESGAVCTCIKIVYKYYMCPRHHYLTSAYSLRFLVSAAVRRFLSEGKYARRSCHTSGRHLPGIPFHASLFKLSRSVTPSSFGGLVVPSPIRPNHCLSR